MTFACTAYATAGIMIISSLPAFAEDTSQSTSPSEATTPAPDAGKPEPTAEERADKQSRKACKVKICAILASRIRKATTCHATSSRPGVRLTSPRCSAARSIGRGAKAVCQSKLEVKRESLVKAMTEASYEVVMPEQKVRCTLAQKKEGDPYPVEVSIAPKVAFEDGKAVNARLNWGEATPAHARLCLDLCRDWTRQFGQLLGPEVVHMMNKFTTKKCAKLKDEGPSNAGN